MPVRFRFCGDDEVPDWILAAINEISHIDVVNLKALAQTVVNAILEPDFTIESDKKVNLPTEFCDYKVSVAALVFILQNSVSYEITEGTLSNELQQIGLPHEHTIVLCRIFTENTNKLKSKAKQLSLRCSIPKSINCIKENDIFIMDTETWQAQSNSVEKNQFTLSKEQIELMISELIGVYEKIDTLV